MSLDPAETNPDHYKVIFENDRVRVLEYTDQPGTVTTPHAHPDSVMYTQHHGENIGETPTHAIFVELKDSTEPTAEGEVGPRLLRERVVSTPTSVCGS